MLNLLPLQTYLGILAMSLSGSQEAMKSLRSGLLDLNPELEQEGLRLQKKLRQRKIPELEKELQKQINEKIAACIEAIPLFCRELELRQNWVAKEASIWRDGSTELYEYRAIGKSGKNQPILIIPSLINRHYILDLEEGNSFVQYIAGQGFDAYIASWGEPPKEELDFSLQDYIGRICSIIDLLYKRTGKKIVLAGYCMGGLLALAAAQMRPEKIKSLAFMATPWDFHEKNFPRFILNEFQTKAVGRIIDASDKIPAVLVQSLFYYMHSNLVGQKFEMRPLLNNKNHSRSGFLAVENWANDGISMTRLVAKECFLGWVQDNNVARFKWKINGKIVSPKKLVQLPAFFAIPKKDSVVPQGSTIPLTKFFENTTIISPNVGHVGMVVGNSAQSQTWEPFVEWLKDTIAG